MNENNIIRMIFFSSFVPLDKVRFACTRVRIHLDAQWLPSAFDVFDIVGQIRIHCRGEIVVELHLPAVGCNFVIAALRFGDAADAVRCFAFQAPFIPPDCFVVVGITASSWPGGGVAPVKGFECRAWKGVVDVAFASLLVCNVSQDVADRNCWVECCVKAGPPPSVR